MSANSIHPATALPRLSQRQLEVLALLEQGHYVKEIPDLLRPPISLNTVKKHCQVLYAKLGADNARQAIWKYRFNPPPQ